MSYLIYCTTRTQGHAVWWGPKGIGYTTDLNTAGRYTEEEAKAIAKHSGGDAVMIHERAIGTVLVTRTVVDLGDGYNAQAIKAACANQVAP